MTIRKKIYVLLTVTIFITVHLSAQNKIIQGYVYGNIYRTPVPSVQVFTSSGNTATTDSNGVYMISALPKNDSIWFNFLGKNTKKYSIDTISNTHEFDIRIYLPDYYKFDNELPTVKVTTRNYYQDSVQLRQDYANIFNWKKPGKALGQSVGVSNAGNGGIGVDFDQIINLFRFGYNRRMQVYQRFAEEMEQDKYVDHRFSKYLVQKTTGLEGAERDSFMLAYRPTYKLLQTLDDTQLINYIQASYKKYIKEKSGIKNNIILDSIK